MVPTQFSEIPTFIIFSSFTLMILSWMATLHAVTKSGLNMMDFLKKITIAANAFMYSVLITIAVLYFKLPNGLDEVDDTCRSITAVSE